MSKSVIGLQRTNTNKQQKQYYNSFSNISIVLGFTGVCSLLRPFTRLRLKRVTFLKAGEGETTFKIFGRQSYRFARNVL